MKYVKKRKQSLTAMKRHHRTHLSMMCTGPRNVFPFARDSDADFALLHLLMEKLNISVLTIARLSINDSVYRENELNTVLGVGIS